MGKGRKLQANSSLSSLGHWLVENAISITHFANSSKLSYRTVWLAVHGYRIDYITALQILKAIKILESKTCSTKTKKSKTCSTKTKKSKTCNVTINELCSGKPRSEFVSITR